ncbi:hypothetical protein LBR_12275 [Levilactobacillus brevis]|uniref:NlpC/P60 family protein n=1 Tax=Levilactobacillus brevis TaxID=1580 RepID=UPI000A1116F3|nr:NlpC/P60 family protein [Levilactobacillus brevis]ORJ52882.1 hypothetical protein LBR_12275 [Levilactobacillus brevis]
MAETKELRHAGIGIDLNVNGLEEFRKANSMLDEFMRSFHEMTGQADKLKESLGSGLNISRDVNQSKESMAGFQSEFRKTAQQADIFKHNLDFSNVGAKDTESMRKLNDQVGKLRSDKITQIKTEMQGSNKSTNDGSEAIKKYSNHVDEAHHRMRRLHDIIFGSFVGTAVSNGLQNLSSGIWQSAKNGFELAEAGERISGQWKNIGLTTKQTEALTAQIGDIRSKADMSGGAIDSMQKKLYALTNSVPVTKTLTNEMAAYGSEAGKTGDQIVQMTNMVAKSLGSKTVSAGFFNRVFGQMPALRKQIQQASGMTNAAFNTALKNSKITGTEMQSWMMKAANGSGSAWKAFSKTTAGQIAAIKGEWQNLEVAFAKPLSAGFAKGMDSITGKNSGLKAARKELENVVKLLGAKVGDYAGKAVAFISQHHSDLNKIATSLFSIVKNLAIGAWKPIASIIKTIGGQSGKASKGLRGFGDALNDISKHKSAIQSVGIVLTGMFAAKKLLGMGTGILGLRKHILEFTSSTRLMGSAIKLLPWALWIAGIAAAIAILVKLYQHDKKFRKFVNGIMASVRKMAKSFKNLWGDAKGIFKNGFKTIESIVNVGIDVLTGDWKGFKKDGVKLIKSFWSLAKDVFKADFDFINDLTGGKLEKMTKAFSNTWKDIGKGWKSFWNGISDWFGDLWKGIVKHVQDGINNVIKVLNSGISGIDSVIHAFGGSSKAIGTINPVHLATGTGALSGQRRAITKPTMAMLNDGHDSPETGNREMLIHPNGMGELIKGTNVMRMLEPGAEVLNATEAKMAMGMQHFASGTGFFSNLWKGTKKVAADAVGGVESGISGIGNFASKAWNGATHLLSTIQKIIAGPGKYLNSLMGKKPSGQGTILSDFAGGFYNSMKKQASTWWSSLWSMASGVLDDSGSASGLLAAVEKYGKGKKYVWGATGPNTFDCSGLVMYALKHAFGIDYPHFSGSQIAKAKSVSKGDLKPGDLVGNNEHIGVYAGNGKYWSAMSPTSHPNIGMSSLSYFPGTPKFGRVPGTEDKSKNNTKSGGSALQKLIKQETGGMMGWIEKHLSPLLDSGGDASGGSVSSTLIRKAASMMGVHPSGADIANIERVIQHESGGNAKAINNWDSNAKAGTPSKGILQFIDPTFQHYAMKGHKNIYSDLDQLLAMFNDTNWRSDVHTGGWGPTGAVRREKGGKLAKNQLSVVGEKGWELFNPDNSGVVIPHEASEKLISGGSKGKVTISAPTKVVIQGNADKSAIDELDSRLQKRNDDLVEKFRELWGLNDEGGLIV